MAKTPEMKDAKSGAAWKAPKTRKAPVSRITPTIDYPQDGEEISLACYKMRIGCPGEAREVEVSVDGGPWQACRSAVGYWWHEFSGGAAGIHRISARARDDEGRLGVSLERVFSVRPILNEAAAFAGGARRAAFLRVR